ncbi:MAG: hypothetical protein ACLQVL_26690 [Terriglobia bacterium]
MSTKGGQARVDETTNYILEDITPPERPAVKQYLQGMIQKMSGGGDIKGLSDPMSMNDLADRGTADERKKRRSLILMSYARGTDLTLVQVKGMAAAQLSTNYFDSIKRLRLLADQENGNGALIQERYNAMIARPLEFLTTNMLFTRGSNTDGVMDQYFFYEYKNDKEGFALCSNVDPHPLKSISVKVVSVPGIVWSDVPGRGKQSVVGSFSTIKGTELTGASLMITTQFSGCAFCVKQVTATSKFFAAHIMPGLEHVEGSTIAGGGQKMALQLSGSDVPAVSRGNFAAPGDGAGTFYVYGSGYSNIVPVAEGYDSKQSMTLIGVLSSTGWHFYRQLSVNRAVTSVKQIL